MRRTRPLAPRWLPPPLHTGQRLARERAASPRAAAARRRGWPAVLEGSARAGRNRNRCPGREGVRAGADGRGRPGCRGRPRLLARAAAGAGRRDVGGKRGRSGDQRLRLFSRLDDLDLPVVLLIGGAAGIEGALVVQFVLAIDDVEAHASHFWLRDSASGSARPFERYLDSLGDIREIQDYIVGRAEKAGVPVIENGNIEVAIAQAMELVLETLANVPQLTDVSRP